MEGPVEVKKSLKELRSELKTHRASSMMPVSKLSRASVIAELSKYGSATSVKPKVEEPKVEEPKAEERPKKRPTNSKVKVVQPAEEELNIKVPKKVPKVVEVNEPKTPKPKAEPKTEGGKKPLTAYQQLWGEARRKGMSPKQASDYAKSKLA
jgi:outer membrane biosynthesis protein TonB